MARAGPQGSELYVNGANRVLFWEDNTEQTAEILYLEKQVNVVL